MQIGGKARLYRVGDAGSPAGERRGIRLIWVLEGWRSGRNVFRLPAARMCQGMHLPGVVDTRCSGMPPAPAEE